MNEARPAYGLLSIVVGKHDPFFGDPINVRCTTAHHASVISADVSDADVIAPDDQYVWFFLRLGFGRHSQQPDHRERQKNALKIQSHNVLVKFLNGVEAAFGS